MLLKNFPTLDKIAEGNQARSWTRTCLIPLSDFIECWKVFEKHFQLAKVGRSAVSSPRRAEALVRRGLSVPDQPEKRLTAVSSGCIGTQRPRDIGVNTGRGWGCLQGESGVVPIQDKRVAKRLNGQAWC